MSDTRAPSEDHAVDELRRHHARRHEAERRDEARELEVGEAEDAVAARAAAGQPRAEADEEPAGKHPRQLARVPEADHPIEHPEIPRRREAAASDRGQKAANHEAGDKWQPPLTGGADRITREVGNRQDEAADVLETGGD